MANYVSINRELELSGLNLVEKPQLVVVNKIDLPEGRENLKLLEGKLPFCAISAATHEGLDNLKRLIGTKLEERKSDEGRTGVSTGL
ncbi:MAG: hypothetical protein ACE10C_08675 [Candidatus Binatia bacterium]